MLPAPVVDAVIAVTGPLDATTARRIVGGCISDAWTLQARDGTRFFLKTGTADQGAQLAAEQAGLAALDAAGAVRVPLPLASGADDHASWLLLEWVELAGDRRRAGQRLGEQLAMLHRHTAATFGWSRDNAIGATPQRNSPSTNWAEFFRDCRLKPQLALADRRGHADLHDAGMALLERLPEYFAGHAPQPSLLHGDLWGGNWGVAPDGEPVIFDPAVYFGDREADLAMTRLFGGFDTAFYEAYGDSWPLDRGFDDRCDLYNLYHVLNHVNLFGGSYRRQAAMLIDDLRSRTLQGN